MSSAAAVVDLPSRPLAKLLGLIERYVVMTPQQRLVVALWIVHAHCIEHFEQTPYLSVTSPERQCGKSRLLELLEVLVPRPWYAVTPSEAVIYRTVEAIQPTLLLDEVDTIFNARTSDRYEGLRAILNAGHRRGAAVPRCVGPNQDVRAFSVYCAKVLAGIGTLPDTIADRSIPIRLQRKAPDEEVARFRRREVEELAKPIKATMEAWTAKQGEELGQARPELPDELSDRMQEGCEPLLAIADALGYADEAREALVSLLSVERADSTERAQLRLLRDVRTAFEQNGNPAALATEVLLATLHGLEESEWVNWYGSPLDAGRLAKLVKPYGIESCTVRVDATTTKKGYRRADFYEAWRRYLADEPVVEEEVEVE